MKLNDFIIYQPTIPVKFCETIIELFESKNQALIRRDNKVQQFTEMNLNTAAPEMAHYLAATSVMKAVETYTDRHMPFGDRFFPELYGLEELRVKRYNEGDYFDQHVDVGDLNSSKRFLAFLFYLNDEYEGGETLFKTPESMLIRPTKGNAVIFPPTWQYPHTGTKVTKGTKYIMSTYLNYVDTESRTHNSTRSDQQ